MDDAGQGLPVGNSHSGEGHAGAMGVAVLGASHSPEAEATGPQSLPDWIGSPVRTCAALGGVPERVVPAHLQAAVTRAPRDAPESNRPSAARAQHDGFAILPARAATPREKATVEVGVPVGERWMLARLRHHTFCSRIEVNAALPPLLSGRNARPCKQVPGSRQQWFDALDRPALRPLPAQPDASAEWQHARVPIDDHVAVEGPSSSVPYGLVKQPRDGRLRAQVVERFAKGTRVASHRRSPLTGRHSPGAAHRPTAPQRDAAWTPQRLMHWAAHRGPATAPVGETLLASRPHPPQGCRACGGIMRLGKSSGDERLEAACQRALTLGACS